MTGGDHGGGVFRDWLWDAMRRAGIPETRNGQPNKTELARRLAVATRTKTADSWRRQINQWTKATDPTLPDAENRQHLEAVLGQTLPAELGPPARSRDRLGQVEELAERNTKNLEELRAGLEDVRTGLEDVRTGLAAQLDALESRVQVLERR